MPRWAETSDGSPAANIVAPVSGKQDTGFGTGGDIPTSGGLNWWMRWVYKWCEYLDALVGETLTWTARQTFDGGATVVDPPVDPTDAASKGYVDDSDAARKEYVDRKGTIYQSTPFAVVFNSDQYIDANIPVSLECSGRPVMLCLVSTGGEGCVGVGNNDGVTATELTLQFLRDGALLGGVKVRGRPTTNTLTATLVPPGAVMFIDAAPPAGAHIYNMRGYVWPGGAGNVGTVNDCKLVAYEL